MSTLSDVVTRIENLIAGDSTYNGVYCRTNRGPVITCSLQTAAPSTSVAALVRNISTSWRPGPRELSAGKPWHIIKSGAARRITASRQTYLSKGAYLTPITCVAFDSAVGGTTTGCILREGFAKSHLPIERIAEDRRFEVRLDGSSSKTLAWGNGVGRFDQDVNVLVAYQFDQDHSKVYQRIAEDHQKITSTLVLNDSQVAGTNIFDEGAGFEYTRDDEKGYVVWAMPYRISYTETMTES